MAYEASALKALETELSRTAVISDSFRSTILSYVYAIAREAYEGGRRDEKNA